MFNLGAQAVWRIYEEDGCPEKDGSIFKAYVIKSMEKMVLGKSYYMVEHINSSKTDTAFKNMHSIMKMSPYSVPQDEDELICFSKMWFDAGTTVMWKYINTTQKQKEKKSDRLFDIIDTIINFI